MKKNIDPFIDFLPKIDLHGFDRVSAKIATEEFINDSLKLRNKKIVIIHGIGENILRSEIHSYLKHNKNVLEYKLHNNNPGETIIILK